MSTNIKTDCNKTALRLMNIESRSSIPNKVNLISGDDNHRMEHHSVSTLKSIYFTPRWGIFVSVILRSRGKNGRRFIQLWSLVLSQSNFNIRVSDISFTIAN